VHNHYTIDKQVDNGALMLGRCQPMVRAAAASLKVTTFFKEGKTFGGPA